MQVSIKHLGHLGDGVVVTREEAAFVPFALPGETAEVSGVPPRYQLEKIIEAAPERIEPKCTHFMTCGGCTMQHLAQTPYLEWKRKLVADAFATRGLTPTIDPCVSVEPATRRRATFSCTRSGADVTLGFSKRLSHDIFHLEECPVLAAPITNALHELREVASVIANQSGDARISVLAVDNGLDVTLSGITTLAERQRQSLVYLGQSGTLIRIAFNDEILIEREKPEIKVGDLTVYPQPESFSQAVGSAEAMMADLVCNHLSGQKNVVDLFSGFGTFALRLAQQSSVKAFESEASALTTLDQAWRLASGLKKVETEERDLMRRPVTAGELKKISGLVFDPPRIGAAEQAEQIAAAHVAKVAAVSCNPATLARDARILVDGGYEITRIVPIDQFLYSPHVEVVALFEDRKKPPRRSIFG